MDISLLYPRYDDVIKHDERREPEIFNYVCLHGKQIFFRVSRGNYEILTVGWRPRQLKDIEQSIETKHLVCRTKDYSVATLVFKRLVNECVLTIQDDFDFGDTTL